MSKEFGSKISRRRFLGALVGAVTYGFLDSRKIFAQGPESTKTNVPAPEVGNYVIKNGKINSIDG